MIGDKCPLCGKGKVMRYALDRGYYCTHGCILYNYYKKEVQKDLSDIFGQQGEKQKWQR